VLGLADRLKAGVAERWGVGALYSATSDPRLRSAMTTFNPFANPADVLDKAKADAFVARLHDEYRITIRNTIVPVIGSPTPHYAMRVSTHLFHRRRDVARFLDAAKAEPTLTTESETQHLDIIASDGSLHWSRDSQAKYTREFVDDFVDNEILRAGPTRPGIDRGAVETMGKLIDWSSSPSPRTGPTTGNGSRATRSRRPCTACSSVATELQETHGAIAYNHYDPAGLPACEDLDNWVDHRLVDIPPARRPVPRTVAA
jgi:hypothetical protein